MSSSRPPSHTRMLALCALFGVSGCEAPLAATEVVARIDSDLAPGSELTRVEARVYGADGNAEELGSAVFAVAAGAAQSTRYALPLSFSIAPQGTGSARRFRVVVAGYGRPAPDQPETLQVERQVISAFRPHRSLRLDVFLGRICLGVLCHDEGALLTCDDDGRCAAVPTALDLPELGASTDFSTQPSVQDGGAQSVPDASPPDPALRDDAGPGADPADASSLPLPGTDAGPAADVGVLDPPDTGTPVDAGCGSPGSAPCSCPPGFRLSAGACADIDECADSSVNSCSPASLCAQTVAPGYTCTGQFADWPMPDAARGVRSAAPAYTVLGDAVRDDVTGLYWLRLVDANAYRSLADAQAYCADLRIAGFDDWRVPSRIELASLLDTTRSGSMIDPTAFPSAPAGLFWTRELQSAGFYWGIHFADATNAGYGEAGNLLVRCVRSGPAASGTPASRYAVDATAGTVRDTRTGLLWQRGVDATPSTYAAAAEACKAAGRRVPTLKELLTLVDPTRTRPAIDPAFPPFPSRSFWTAAAVTGSTGEVYLVSFDDGAVARVVPSATTNFAVRCVGPL